MLVEELKEYPKQIILEEGQHWKHSKGEIAVIRRYGSYGTKMAHIDQLHVSRGMKWFKCDLPETELKSYLWLTKAKLVVLSNKIWKELCLK